jgi:cytidine deaminase
MKNIEIVCRLVEFDNPTELNDEEQDLIREARESAIKAYAPYSDFHVGAAVLLENGKIIRGNNQENASYPIGLCAERVAIFSAGANYPNVKIKSIAITAWSGKFHIHKPVPPCGACRQAIAEYENRFRQNIKILLTGETGKIIVSESIQNLLPLGFNADDLKKKTP